MTPYLIYGIVLFSIFSIGLYFAILVIWPEWLGISGKETRKAYEAQTSQSPTETQSSGPEDA